MKFLIVDSFKQFFAELKKNPILRYNWFVTIVLILFYAIILILFGPAESLPTPGDIPTIQGITFLLLITFSFFLLFLFVISWKESLFSKLEKDKTDVKLIGLNLIFFFGSLLIPIIIFVGLYIVAYFLWYLISALFLVLFSKDLSIKVAGSVSTKKGFKGLILYLLSWLIFIVLFGLFYQAINWEVLNISQQMILMVFPVFSVILPILGLILKPKTGYRAPITLYGLLIFALILYNWVRYLNWTQTSSNFTIFDAVIDIILITYVFFTLFKNANKVSEIVKNKIDITQILFLFIWTRISSMILLYTVSEYEIFGISASEGTYLSTMFLTIVVGFIIGIIWIKKGISRKDLNSKISLPETTGDFINR